MKNLVLYKMKFALMAVLLVLAILPVNPARAAVIRFYLQTAPSLVTTTNQGTWDDATGAPTLILSQTKFGSVSARGVAETSATSGYSVMILKLVSEPIPAQTISGTLNWALGAQESSNAANDFYKVYAYVASNDGATIRGTLLSNDIDTNEWPTSAGGLTPATAKTLTDVSAQAGDRIIIEVGYSAQNTSTATRTGTLWYGGTDGDMTAGGATTLTGWFEFSNLTPDTAAPTVDTFTANPSSKSLNIPITTFTASDDVSVSGYMITESATPPTAGDPGWTGTAPTTYTVASDGTYTLYPWAKDGAGNVSSVFASPVTVVVDSTSPSVDDFTVTSPTNSLAIPITTFTATDNVGVTGYKITESATPPAAGDPGWTGTAPTTHTVASEGTYTLYPWAKDADGNVSSVYASPRTVEVDTTVPTVNTFTVASLTNSLNIPITAFIASDNTVVTGYMITESAVLPTAGDAGWTGTAPTVYPVASDGTYSLYPWARDAAGNISSVYASPRTVKVDTISPSITSIVRTNPNPTYAASVIFTVTFSEAVTGVDVGDFLLFKTGLLTGESITSISGGPILYTVTVSTGTRNGTLRLDVPDTATITDLALNPLTGLPYTSGETYTVPEVFQLFLPLIMR